MNNQYADDLEDCRHCMMLGWHSPPLLIGMFDGAQTLKHAAQQWNAGISMILRKIPIKRY